ncbi:MAG TPA: metalloregulator ArsR/SmtB family transcription factor [Methanocella sp.]|uniref:ArsR/SmtB family transcription factor n=1 Tax=Methanocella sp. TaxID=2052833 RepID=UPI002CD8B921|nr:metalloregulator ArsR/SmtB family transcription factor [Methanocella sp.]HTY89629.1 metalloregulator ArsR/SmtB family transcription factor [Methanocella sp.]
MDYELAEESADLFKALGDNTRVRLIYVLASGKPEKIGVTELAAMMGITQPAASQHLKILKNARLVRAKKEGNHVYYTFDREAVLKHKERVDDLFGRVFEKCDQRKKEG